MKKSKKLCRTNATAILKFFSFKDDTFAFFYEVRKNNLVKYYVNCNKKVYGPYEKVGKSDNPDIAETLQSNINDALTQEPVTYYQPTYSIITVTLEDKEYKIDVIGNLRRRSIRAYNKSFESNSKSSHEPR